MDELKARYQDRKIKYDRQVRMLNSSPAWNDLIIAGEENKREDGFVHWNPIGDITSSGDKVRDLVQQASKSMTKKTPVPINENKLMQIGRELAVWLKMLRDFRTADTELDKVRDTILKYFGFDLRDNAQTYINHRLIISELREEFQSRASRHGKVMIFNNVEESILSSRPGQTHDPNAAISYNFEGGTPFGRLGSLMRSEEEKRSTQEAGGDAAPIGRRSVVLISDEPMTNLKGASTVVELPNEPITEDESKIIVSNMLDSWEAKNKEFSIKDSVRAIEENFTDQIDDLGERQGPPVVGDPRLVLQKRKKAAMNREYSLIENRLGVVRMNSKKQMMQTLVGMPLTEAIDTFRSMLRSNTEEVLSEDGKRVVGLELSQDTIVKDLLGMYNEKSSKAAGMTIREPTIRFGDYAYKKEFTQEEVSTKEGVKLQNWAARVGVIADKANDIGRDQARIQQIEAYIQSKQTELRSGKRDETNNRVVALTDEERVAVNAQITNAKAEMDGLERRVYSQSAKELPHFMILYGPPGTGKSIWADAFGDLMKFMIRQVDVSQFKNMWYGESGKNMDIFINEMLTTKNTIYLFDEIDKQVAQSHGGKDQTESSPHQVDEEMTGKLLQTLSEDAAKKKMEDNNTYVIMTTNEIMYVNDALKSRTEGHVYYVPDPISPDVVEDFMRNYISQKYLQDSDNPPINVYLGQGYDEAIAGAEKPE
ncbi:MAG: AAA family ATPase, partial [Candidatus Thorarchaeota archaeon]